MLYKRGAQMNNIFPNIVTSSIHEIALHSGIHSSKSKPISMKPWYETE